MLLYDSFFLHFIILHIIQINFSIWKSPTMSYLIQGGLSETMWLIVFIFLENLQLLYSASLYAFGGYSGVKVKAWFFFFAAIQNPDIHSHCLGVEDGCGCWKAKLIEDKAQMSYSKRIYMAEGDEMKECWANSQVARRVRIQSKDDGRIWERKQMV